MSKFQIGDIVVDIEGEQSDKHLFGVITSIDNKPLRTYDVDWFVDENDKTKYCRYMYEDEIKKVA